MDRPSSSLCADQMLVQVTDLGERVFVFRTADDATILLAAIDMPPNAAGEREMPVSRLQLAFRGRAETIPVLSGTCRATDPTGTFRAETACEAQTLQGRFTVQFVTIDGAVEPVAPSDVPPAR